MKSLKTPLLISYTLVKYTYNLIPNYLVKLSNRKQFTTKHTDNNFYLVR